MKGNGPKIIRDSAITCSVLPPLRNGDIVPPKCGNKRQKVMLSCAFNCDDGFRLQGPMFKQCETSGNWSSDEQVACVGKEINTRVPVPSPHPPCYLMNSFIHVVVVVGVSNFLYNPFKDVPNLIFIAVPLSEFKSAKVMGHHESTWNIKRIL